jgi:hypothetical protein
MEHDITTFEKVRVRPLSWTTRIQFMTHKLFPEGIF